MNEVFKEMTAILVEIAKLQEVTGGMEDLVNKVGDLRERLTALEVKFDERKDRGNETWDMIKFWVPVAGSMVVTIAVVVKYVILGE
jgi:phage-related minor tail protein